MLQRNLVSNYKRCISNKNGVGQGMPEGYSRTRIALISDAAFATTLMDDSRGMRICEYVSRVLRVSCVEYFVSRSIFLILALIRAKSTNPGTRKREKKMHARRASKLYRYILSNALFHPKSSWNLIIVRSPHIFLRRQLSFRIHSSMASVKT